MKYNKTFREALQQVREDGHTDVASAIRSCKTTIEDASQMLSKLQGMDPEGDLPSWWMKKIAVASDNMNKLRDYLLVPSVTREQQEVPKEPKEDKSADEIQSLKNKIQQLELELKIEKDKTVKPEPNPDTGEIPLRTGLANALLDKNAKNKPEANGINKKKLKMSLGKSKVEVNPDVEIGVFSGGKNTPTGNLH
tara:strand:+ start:812 stop:1393 length:582 start_codon:yes stop_codon:yes gene_type:complete